MLVAGGKMDVNIGIVVSGAIVVIITAFFIFRPNLKRSAAKARQKNEETGEKSSLPTWKTKRNIIRNLRSLRKHRKPEDQSPQDTGTPPEEELPAVFPEVTVPELQPDAPSSLPDIETPDIVPVSEETEVNVMDNLMMNQEQTLSESEQLTVEETIIEPRDDLPDETAATGGEQPQEEQGTSVFEPEKEETSGGEEQPEKVKSDDNMFDLFTEEVLEESDVSKLAATLNNVDIDDLLEEVYNTKKYLGGS
jgi:hypothetical protein